MISSPRTVVFVGVAALGLVVSPDPAEDTIKATPLKNTIQLDANSVKAATATFEVNNAPDTGLAHESWPQISCQLQTDKCWRASSKNARGGGHRPRQEHAVHPQVGPRPLRTYLQPARSLLDGSAYIFVRYAVNSLGHAFFDAPRFEYPRWREAGRRRWSETP